MLKQLSNQPKLLEEYPVVERTTDPYFLSTLLLMDKDTDADFRFGLSWETIQDCIPRKCPMGQLRLRGEMNEKGSKELQAQ